jgi:hypothetical protein
MSVDPSLSTAIPVPNRTLRPHRQYDRDAAPLGTADPHEDMNPLATSAANRIRANRRDRQVGSLVFGDPEGRVYVIKQDSACADRMLKQRPAWHVGTYASEPSNGSRPVCPQAEQLVDDLRQHFLDIGFVSAAQVYDEIRMVEG